MLQSQQSAALQAQQTRAFLENALANTPTVPLSARESGGSSLLGRADEYYYRMPDGDLKGPVTLAQLNEWVTHGLLGDKIMVRRGNEKAFYELGYLLS